MESNEVYVTVFKVRYGGGGYRNLSGDDGSACL